MFAASVASILGIQAEPVPNLAGVMWDAAGTVLLKVKHPANSPWEQSSNRLNSKTIHFSTYIYNYIYAVLFWYVYIYIHTYVIIIIY
jgi:hypothetical protein